MSSSHYTRQEDKRAGYVRSLCKNAILTVKKQGPELQAIFDRIRKASDIEAGKMFGNEVLPM